MRGVLDEMFTKLKSGDEIVDRMGLRWKVDGWRSCTVVFLIAPKEQGGGTHSVTLGWFQDRPCLATAGTLAAIDDFLGMTEIEVVKSETPPRGPEYLDPRCPQSTLNNE